MLSSIIRGLKLERFDPDRIVTSNIVRPRTLAIVRGILLLYILIALIVAWVRAEGADQYLKFFTNMTYLGLTGYLIATTVWSIGYLRQPESEREQWLRKGSLWWGWTHWLLYTTVITYHIIVPLVFWTVLSVGMDQWTTMDKFQNASVHGMDGFVAVVELIFNRHFLHPIHSLLVAAVMVLYMFLTFVVYKVQGTWVYPFLDWDQGAICVAYYLGMAVGMFIIFFILFFIHKYRNKWLSKRCQKVNPQLSAGDYDQHQHNSTVESIHQQHQQEMSEKNVV